MSFCLSFELGDLERTAGHLTEIADTAREIDDHHRRMAATVQDCGSAELASAAADFLDDWSYGMKIIAADAEGLGEAIGECASVYAATDEAGAAAVRAGG